MGKNIFWFGHGIYYFAQKFVPIYQSFTIFFREEFITCSLDIPVVHEYFHSEWNRVYSCVHLRQKIWKGLRLSPVLMQFNRGL